MCLFTRAWRVFLTCKENRTQRGTLALNFIRVGILAQYRTSGWLFKPKLNSALQSGWSFKYYICFIPKCPGGCRVLQQSVGTMSGWKQNQHFHALVSCISMINGCYLLKQQYNPFSFRHFLTNEQEVSVCRWTLLTLGLYYSCANLEESIFFLRHDWIFLLFLVLVKPAHNPPTVPRCPGTCPDRLAR